MQKSLGLKIAYRIKSVAERYIQRVKNIAEKKEEESWHNKFEGKEGFIHEHNGFKIKLYEDSLLSKAIYKGFEADEETFIRKFLRQGEVFLDIGANIGLHTISASTVLGSEGKVYSFEPTPKTFNRLKENISLNNLEEIVTPVQIGLSDKEGTLNFNIYGNGYDAWNSFAVLENYELSQHITVSADTLDNQLQKLGIEINRISLVKIDVEGWELFVIKGSEHLLQNSTNINYIVEFTEENAFGAGTNCNAVFIKMEQSGFKWFTYDSEKNCIVPAKMKPYYPYENLIASKDPESVNKRLLSKSHKKEME